MLSMEKDIDFLGDQIAEYLIEGRTYAEIASKCMVSKSTVARIKRDRFGMKSAKIENIKSHTSTDSTSTCSTDYLLTQSDAIKLLHYQIPVWLRRRIKFLLRLDK